MSGILGVPRLSHNPKPVGLAMTDRYAWYGQCFFYLSCDGGPGDTPA
jgi:hypothetical protein